VRITRASVIKIAAQFGRSLLSRMDIDHNLAGLPYLAAEETDSFDDIWRGDKDGIDSGLSPNLFFASMNYFSPQRPLHNGPKRGKGAWHISASLPSF
jgi:hypothetical protein